MAGVHFFAHRQHLVAQLGGVARRAEDLAAQGLEARADFVVAADEAGTRQRLVFPYPRVMQLVVAEGLGRADQEARRAVGAQAQVGFVQHAGRGEGAEPGVDALGEARVDFLRAVVIVVVEKHQIEVGGVAELLAAELAVADDCEARGVAVARLEPGPTTRQGFGEQGVGQIRQMVRQRLERQPPGHVLRQQAQRLHLLEAAQRIHLRFGVAGMRVEFVAQLRGELRPVGHAHQRVRRDQFVEQLRLPRDHLRRPRARRQQAHQLAQ
ncbi:MAG: hypothetical protein H6R09_209, partial [Proteobacteria bacterium]|nr:hypothetical protein [Pseudomonadota bacterium]